MIKWIKRVILKIILHNIRKNDIELFNYFIAAKKTKMLHFSSHYFKFDTRLASLPLINFNNESVVCGKVKIQQT